jgi:hypothetical protein
MGIVSDVWHPSRMPVKRLIAAELAVGTLIGGTIAAAAPAANAYPGDPMPGCENGGMFNATLYCDGPIRPDGTWQRCATWQPNYVPPVGSAPGFYAPGGQQCRVIDAGSIPFGTPDHHIGD